MTLFFHGLWMTCAFGCAVFAVGAASSLVRLVAMAVAFGATAALARPTRLPDAALVAGGIFLIAVVRLVRPTPAARVITAAGAGAVAAVWAALFQSQGVPFAAALPLAAALPAMSAWMAAGQMRFAPAQMVDEALLIVAALSALLAVAPGLVSGWQSAVALNVDGQRAADAVALALPQWTVMTTLAAAALGGAYSLWTRR